MAAMPPKLEQLAAQLKEISESLSAQETGELSAPSAKRVRKTITEAYEKLRMVVDGLDPIKQPDSVFDPSNPNVAGRIIAITMVAQPRKPLAKIERFYGSGVYALYYTGDFPSVLGDCQSRTPNLRGQGRSRQPGEQDRFGAG